MGPAVEPGGKEEKGRRGGEARGGGGKKLHVSKGKEMRGMMHTFCINTLEILQKAYARTERGSVCV